MNANVHKVKKVVLNSAVAFVARWTVTQNRRGN